MQYRPRPLCVGYLKHLDTHMTYRCTNQDSLGTSVLEVRGRLQCSVHTDRHSKDNYILFPSIKLNCPNNGMACSQQYCCVLLRTIIELTVHFFTRGWNIKFDQILVLMLLHFASLPVLLDDRRICAHSTMTESHSCGRRLTWSRVQKLELQNVIQCKSGKTGQRDRNQTREWQVSLWIHRVTDNAVVCDGFAAISQSNSWPLWTLDELVFLTRGKCNTDKEYYNMCLFYCSVKREAGDYIWTFPVIGFQIFFFRLLFRETHHAYGLVSLFSRTRLALGVCLNAFSSCFVIRALTQAGITA